MHRNYITHLATHIAEHGTSAVERDLMQLARYARRHCIAIHAAGVMVDRASPQIVRQRAFAVVSSAVANASPGTPAALAMAS